MTFSFLVSLLLMTLPVNPPATREVELRPNWLGFNGTYYEPFDSVAANKSPGVFISLYPGNYPPASVLRITCKRPVSVFVDDVFSGTSGKAIHIVLDSLWRATGGSPAMIAVYPRTTLESLSTVVVIPRLPSSGEIIVKRPLNFFANFVIIGALIILLLLVLARQLNEKLLHDYFSFRQLLMRRESDEVEQFSRIRGSSNIIFYMLSAVTVSFLLTLGFQFSPTSVDANGYHAETFGQAMGLWGQVTAVVLLTFFLKWMIIILASVLFDVSEIIRNYFFNWMRVLLILVMPLLTAVVGYYWLRGASGFTINYGLAFTFLSIGWVIVIFYKLRWRVRFSLFHLISYICITELIPLLIFSKVFQA